MLLYIIYKIMFFCLEKHIMGDSRPEGERNFWNGKESVTAKVYSIHNCTAGGKESVIAKVYTTVQPGEGVCYS